MWFYPTLYLTWSIFKTTFREPLTLIWAFILPLVVIVPFGFLNIGQIGTVDLVLIDRAGNDASERFAASVGEHPAINLILGAEADERAALVDGQRDMVVILPADFNADGSPSPIEILRHANRAKEAEIGEALLRWSLDEFRHGAAGPPGTAILESRDIAARDVGYRDWLIPGIIAAAIMQIGMLSVSFTFLGMKRTGVLRRLRVTPLNPAALIIAHSVSRLMIMALQATLLTAVAVFGLGIEFAGNFLALLLAAVLGGAVFLAMGFAISGGTSTERLAAPLANVIVLAMMFLCGVFFTREHFPGILGVISDYLPLSLMMDIMRGSAVYGQPMIDHWANFLGLVIWLVGGLIVAKVVFRWE